MTINLNNAELQEKMKKRALCVNESCPNSEIFTDLPYVDFEDGTRVYKHLYRSKGVEFFVCDVCHDALQLVLKKC